MYNFISEHSKLASYIKSTFLPYAPSRDPNNGPPTCLFLEESISERRGMDSGKPFSSTSSGSNTIRSWSPTSSIDAVTTFATHS
ncbi:hypothetical protein TNCV_4494211 [Trichonephila clavipes]|nr:hypothetical protein TNCV_4494211 [Trichonephila clavipes]